MGSTKWSNQVRYFLLESGFKVDLILKFIEDHIDKKSPSSKEMDKLIKALKSNHPLIPELNQIHTNGVRDFFVDCGFDVDLIIHFLDNHLESERFFDKYSRDSLKCDKIEMYEREYNHLQIEKLIILLQH